jgi:CheY-like chemotaxis protein
LLALALGLLGLVGETLGQEAAKGAAKPLVLYANFRELVGEGKFDLAGAFLQAFLDSNPSEADLLEIEKKYGNTVFQSLRTIPRWSDDAAADKKTRANVEELIKRARAANAKLLYDPARVAKYIRNLGATYEERVYAELELKRTGDYAIPFMVDELRITRDKAIYSGLLESITVIEGSTIAGWVAALDGFTPDQQSAVIAAIATREDVLNLQTFVQSDLAPFLWRIMLQPRDQNPAFRAQAERLLNRLQPGAKADAKLPEVELTALARTFYDNTARFANPRMNPDGSPVSVPVWIWDGKSSKLVKNEEVPIGQAEEYFGLRYCRWVLEQKPDYEPAQGLLISLAAERAIERAHFGNLARTEPAVYKLLADAPSVVLADQLNRGLNQKKTGLALAMLQVLGDRDDRSVATPPAGATSKPSLLVKALSYPDPQVQFAAVNALLRSPVPVPLDYRPQIVDILRRAVGADASSDSPTGTALLADPNKIRADSVAYLLRGLGYHVEVVTTGRDLLRRIARSSDFDVILIDRHTPNPELIDLVGQIQADVKAANRPTLIVASSDKSRVPTFEQLVVRFSALIASTENESVGMPAPFVPDPRDREKLEEIAKARKANADFRDGVYRRTAEERLNRLRRLVDMTGITLTDSQKLLLSLRMELLAYTILGIQFPYSAESAPETASHVATLRRQLERQPLSPPLGAGLPTAELIKLLERFETDLDRVPARKKEFDTLYAKLDPTEFGIPVETFREPQLEARLGRTLRNYPGVRIISEPFARAELASDLKASYRDPAQAPRDPAEKKAAQKTAVDWLRKMAIGEVAGYDIKSAEPELRSALRVDDVADQAVEALASFGSAAAQESLLSLVLNGTKPVALRTKAADALIRQIQVHGKAISKTLLPPLVELANSEPDLTLRSKLLTLKGLLAYSQEDFVNQLKAYQPPLLPVPVPVKEPAKEPAKEPPPAQ